MLGVNVTIWFQYSKKVVQYNQYLKIICGNSLWRPLLDIFNWQWLSLNILRLDNNGGGVVRVCGLVVVHFHDGSILLLDDLMNLVLVQDSS